MNLAPSELMAGSAQNMERLRRDAMTSQKHRGFTQYVVGVLGRLSEVLPEGQTLVSEGRRAWEGGK